MRLAIVSESTTVIAHTGRGVQLAEGAYPVVDVDGAADRGEVYVTGPGETLVCVNPNDPAITFATAGDPYFRPDMPPEMLAGFVIGQCGHRVAGSEWKAGFRVCERCPSPSKKG